MLTELKTPELKNLANGGKMLATLLLSFGLSALPAQAANYSTETQFGTATEATNANSNRGNSGEDSDKTDAPDRGKGR